MPLACRICIMHKGLLGSEVKSLPKTEEELWDHLESEHHVIVKREGESAEQATARFLKKYPDAVNCEDCKRRGAPWTK